MDLARAPQGRSEVTGELRLGGWRFRPKSSRGRRGRAGQLVRTAEFRGNPEVRGGGASGPSGRGAGHQEGGAAARPRSARNRSRVAGRGASTGSDPSKRAEGGGAGGGKSRQKSLSFRAWGDSDLSQARQWDPRDLVSSGVRSPETQPGPRPPFWPVGAASLGSNFPQMPLQVRLSLSATALTLWHSLAGAWACEREVSNLEFPKPT